MTAFLITTYLVAQHRLGDVGRRLDSRRSIHPTSGFGFRLAPALRSGQARQSSSATRAGQSGQATAEYALVLLGVAAIALLLAAWAAKSGKVGQLFDAVVDQLIDKVR